MKPQKLILCGWGPYKEETVIDFTKLNTDLFLITGPTGAGKTTLFDAIAYALYGTLSGEVREKGTVRSDFADENTKTFAELFMSHKGKDYHILRNPEYMRPKKKKNGENAYTREKENAALTLPDGSIIAGNQDVTMKVEEILGMDGKQFRQISMIAQGEFARMLFANPAEKTAIFRELFGTGIYAAVQNGLKERSAGLYRDYMNYKHKMEEDVALLDLEEEEWKTLISYEQPDYTAIEQYLGQFLNKLEIETETGKKEEAKVQSELLTLREELTRIKEWNKRFDELDESKVRLEKLEAGEEVIEKKKTQIKVLQATKILVLEEKAVLQKEQALVQEGRRLETLEKKYQSCLAKMKNLDVISAYKEDIREAYLLRTNMEENSKALLDNCKKTEQINSSNISAKEEYLAAQKEFEQARAGFEEADKRYKNAAIGIAAQYVEEGKPCPVCGSLHHPHIAEIAKEIPDKNQLEELQKQAEKAGERAAHLYETVLDYQKELEILAGAGRELQKIYEELRQKEKAMPDFVLDYVNSEKQKVFEEKLIAYVEMRTKAEEIEKQKAESVAEYEEKQKESLLLRQNFILKLQDAGFENMENYTYAVGILDKLDGLEREVNGYREELFAARKLYEHLEESLKGKERSEQDGTEQLFLQKQGCLEEVRNRMQKKHTQAEQIRRSLSGICENKRRAESIRAEYGVVKDLDDMANGNNSRRLVFEQYVLAGYFEQILKAANLRLFSMTDGRYELIRAKQVSDGRRKDNLEILVMDYYTGKERSVKTLSGGEVFKASLALALGMSDCIQAHNGGIEVETLFIDEGFGALDEESLEQSCMVLQSLADTNRMIGIISHVPELRERIDSQIIIEKKNFGSSVTVRA